MKKEKLIEKLNEMPDNIEVGILDWRKSLNRDYGEGTTEGIYVDYEVSYVDDEDGKNPFVVLSFDNEEYAITGEHLDNH
jgi:hypothetical protein